MSDTLLLLDFEANCRGPSMTLEQARAFVTHVHDAIGRWSVALVRPRHQAVARNLDGYGSSELLAVARAVRADCSGAGELGQMTMWQYTDGSLGPAPHEVVGQFRSKHASNRPLRAYQIPRRCSTQLIAFHC